MRVNDIAKIIESDFPTSLSFDRDNVGLLVGDGEAEVQTALLTCDVDCGVVDEAIEKGANLIVSHHPLMFHPTRRMTESDPEQRTICKMIRAGISMYAAHTNLDAACGGINDYMAYLTGIGDTSVADVVCTNERGIPGYGRIGTLAEPEPLGGLIRRIIKTFDADGVRYTGDLTRPIKRVAVNTGGGADILYRCIELGCDVLITGDIKYNAYRDAEQSGMAVIDLMHFDSEHIVKDFFADYFSKNIPDVQTVKSIANQNVVKTFSAAE